MQHIQIKCTKCGNITSIERDCPQRAISMESDKCPECTDFFGNDKENWNEWYIDKDGNKF